MWDSFYFADFDDKCSLILHVSCDYDSNDSFEEQEDALIFFWQIFF